MTKLLARLVLDLPNNRSICNIIRNTSYKSAISLDNIYPTSSLKITTPSAPQTKEERFNGYIPIEQLEVTYSKSSGPGGQNVNKVNTKCDVRFHLQSAKWLDDDIKAKLAEKFKTKMTNDGYMVFRSDITRFQQMNLADCLEKIRASVRNIIENEPKQDEDTPERMRRRFEKAARQRLAEKRQRAQVKADRKAPLVQEL